MVTPAFGELIGCMVQDPVVQACTAGTIVEKVGRQRVFFPTRYVLLSVGLRTAAMMAPAFL
jgi:hypothetical protein